MSYVIQRGWVAFSLNARADITLCLSAMGTEGVCRHREGPEGSGFCSQGQGDAL